jgi:hypothetical protein
MVLDCLSYRLMRRFKNPYYCVGQQGLARPQALGASIQETYMITLEGRHKINLESSKEVSSQWKCPQIGCELISNLSHVTLTCPYFAMTDP